MAPPLDVAGRRWLSADTLIAGAPPSRAELSRALPAGTRLPTKWDWLAALREAGLDILAGEYSRQPLRRLWTQAPLRLRRPHPANHPQSGFGYAGTNSLYWVDPVEDGDDLLVLFESQNDGHFTFSQSRPDTTAFLRLLVDDPVRDPLAGTAGVLVEQRQHWLAAETRPTPAPGWLTDPRDNCPYRTVTIGGLRWMADDLCHQVEGSLPDIGPEAVLLGDRPPDAAEAVRRGRRYLRGAAAAACPPGWRLPTMDEWEDMLHRFGCHSFDAHPTPRVLWQALRPGGRSGLQLVPGGIWQRPTPATLRYLKASGTVDKVGRPLDEDARLDLLCAAPMWGRGEDAVFWAEDGEVLLSAAAARVYRRSVHAGELLSVRCVQSVG